MDQADLLEKISSGNGKVSLRLGVTCAQYRNSGSSSPISAGNQIDSLSVYFSPADKLQTRPEWITTFDYSNSMNGDYLVTCSGITYFIASQMPFLPIICVQTNSVINISRPMGTGSVESGGYSGVVASMEEALLVGWPAAVIVAGKAKDGVVPDDEGLGLWSIMLPDIPVVPLVADLISDNLSRTFVVTAAEQTVLGWQLRAKQVSS